MNPFRPTVAGSSATFESMEEGMGPVCRTNYCGRRQFTYATTVEQPNTFLEELRKLENEINEIGNENLCTTNAQNNGGMAAGSHSSRVSSGGRHDDSLQTPSQKQDHRRRHSRKSRHNRREHRDSRKSHSSDHHRHRQSPESERRRRHDKERRSRSPERRRSDDRRSRSRHGEKRHRSRSQHRKSTDRSSLEKRPEHVHHSRSFEQQQSSQQKGAEDQAESTKFTVPILFSVGASSDRRGSLYEDVSDTNSKDGDEPLTKKTKSSYAQKEVPEPSVIFTDKLQPITVREYSFWGTESHIRPSPTEGKNFETTPDIWKCMPGSKARDPRIRENLGSRREQPTDANETTDVRLRHQCNQPLGLQGSEFDLPHVPKPPAGPVEQDKTLKPSPLENRECENKTVPADGRNTSVTGRRPVIDYIDKNGCVLYSRPIRDGSNVTDRTPRMSEIIIGDEKVTKPRRVGSSHRENSQASSNNHGTKTSDRSSNIDQSAYRSGTPSHTAALWKAALQVLPTPEAPSEAQASAHTAALWEVASQVLPTPEAISEAQASAHTAALWEVASQVLPSSAQERPRSTKDKLQEEFDRFMDGISTSNSVNTSTNNKDNTLPQPPYQTTSTGTQLSSAGMSSSSGFNPIWSGDILAARRGQVNVESNPYDLPRTALEPVSQVRRPPADGLAYGPSSTEREGDKYEVRDSAASNPGFRRRIRDATDNSTTAVQLSDPRLYRDRAHISQVENEGENGRRSPPADPRLRRRTSNANEATSASSLGVYRPRNHPSVVEGATNARITPGSHNFKDGSPWQDNASQIRSSCGKPIITTLESGRANQPYNIQACKVGSNTGNFLVPKPIAPLPPPSSMFKELKNTDRSFVIRKDVLKEPPHVRQLSFVEVDKTVNSSRKNCNTGPIQRTLGDQFTQNVERSEKERRPTINTPFYSALLRKSATETNRENSLTAIRKKENNIVKLGSSQRVEEDRKKAQSSIEKERRHGQVKLVNPSNEYRKKSENPEEIRRKTDVTSKSGDFAAETKTMGKPVGDHRKNNTESEVYRGPDVTAGSRNEAVPKTTTMANPNNENRKKNEKSEQAYRTPHLNGKGGDEPAAKTRTFAYQKNENQNKSREPEAHPKSYVTKKTEDGHFTRTSAMENPKDGNRKKSESPEEIHRKPDVTGKPGDRHAAKTKSPEKPSDKSRGKSEKLTQFSRQPEMAGKTGGKPASKTATVAAPNDENRKKSKDPGEIHRKPDKAGNTEDIPAVKSNTIANLTHESENETAQPIEVNVTNENEQAIIKTSKIVNVDGPSQPELPANDSSFTKGVVHTNEEKVATNDGTRVGTPGQIDVHASSDLKTTGEKADEFIFKVPPIPKRRRLARPLPPPRWQVKLASWSKKGKKSTKHKANNQSQRNPNDKLKNSNDLQHKQVNESKRHATFKINPRSSSSSWNILSTPKKNMGLWMKKFAVSIYAPDKDIGGKVDAPGADIGVSATLHAPDPRLTVRVRHKKPGRLPSHRRIVAASKQRLSASKNPMRVNSAKKPLKRLQIKGAFRRIDGKLQPMILGARLKKKIKCLLQKKYGPLQILVSPQLIKAKGLKGATIKQKPVDPSDSNRVAIASLNKRIAANVVSDTKKCARKPQQKNQGTLPQKNRARPPVPPPIDSVEIKQGPVDLSDTNQVTNNLNAENVTPDPKKLIRKITIKIQRPTLQKQHTRPTILPIEGSSGVIKQKPVDPSDSDQTATANLDKKESFVKTTTARQNRHGKQEMSDANTVEIQSILQKLPLTKKPGLVLKLENPRVDKLYPIYANDLPLIAEMKLFYRKLGPLTSMMSANSIKIIMAQEFKDQLAKAKDIGLDVEKCLKALEVGFSSTKKSPTSNKQDHGSNNNQLNLNKGRPEVVCRPPMLQLLEKHLQHLHRKKGKELNDYFLSISFDTYQKLFLLLVRTVGYYKCKKFKFTRFREVFGIMKYEIGRILLARAEALKNEMMGLMFLERMAFGTARVILSTPTEMALMDSFAEQITPFTLEKKVDDLIRETKDYLLTEVPRPVDKKSAKTDFAKGVDKFENIIYKTKLVADRRAKHQRARYFKRRNEMAERKEKARVEAEKAATDASANNSIRGRTPDSQATGEGCSSTVAVNKTRNENRLSEQGAPTKSPTNNNNPTNSNSTNALTTDNATTKKEAADPSGMQKGVKSKKGSEEVKKAN